MFNVKNGEFYFQVFDYATIRSTSFLLSQNDIKVLDECLEPSCRIPILTEKPFHKMAFSDEHILLMRNDFGIVGGEEGHEIHAPSLYLLLLDRSGAYQSSHTIPNGYGLAISIQGKELNLIYSGFCDSVAVETEIVNLKTDLEFNLIKRNLIPRDDACFEFPV
ncbi:MAG: hypothetical protein EBR67_10960, partial [Proteobacteria bacterium]|nr:hypothetical protein [Pseudomonadota bacterium]